MSTNVATSTIKTDIPARLDRLPWARFHWLVVIGLGTVWILDGLEVTLVGSIGSRLTESGSGIDISAGGIGIAAATYVAGACLGALVFGQLTDRFGRKKLFMITLGLYIAATTATAFAFSPFYFYAVRFLTGAGIGGEYSAINSAIDELIPARVRGRVDLLINGSYWLGSAAGSAAALFFLDTSIFAKDFGWRVAFGVGAVLGLTIMLVRRNVPESPRWLFIHGQQEEAERIVDGIEERTQEETDRELPEAEGTITVRQRESIPFREIARTAFKLYPKRSLLGLSLFVGQAFLYNGVVFNLGALFTKYFNVSSSYVPVFVILYALGNFLGPVTLGRLFDTVGRKPMIVFTYIGSSLVAVIMALLFMNGSLTAWTLEALIMATFFLASAGASAAYLTVSEIFPMETRALAIAFFYAVGTAAGGIAGPLLFSNLIGSGNRSEVAIAFFIGAALMTLGGVAEMLFGVKAEGQQLEDIAKPLTVDDAEGADDEEEDGIDTSEEHREALRCRAEALEERAYAAEHRATVRELEALDDGERARGRIAVESALAEIAVLRAQAMEERASAHDEHEAAQRAESEEAARAAEARAAAADERAYALERQADAIAAEREVDGRRQEYLAVAAQERARAGEQQALANEALARDSSDGAARALGEARAEAHEAWSTVHEERARLSELRAEGRHEAALEEQEHLAQQRERLALAAEERATAAEHRAAEAELLEDEQRSAEAAQAQRRERERRERDRRVRERLSRGMQDERRGLRRFRPGPGGNLYAPRMVGTTGADRAQRAWDREREIDAIARVLDEHGAVDRRELRQLVGGRYWGPGRFREALHDAEHEGRIRRVAEETFAPVEGAGDDQHT